MRTLALERVRAAFRGASDLSDESLIALTAERVAFRESADAAALKADDAAGKLTRLTGWLIAFTVGLVVLTVRLLSKG